VAGLLLTAATVTLSAGPPTTAGAAVLPPGRQTWVQGDSVMAGAGPTVEQVLRADGWEAVAAGWPGLHTWAAVPLFAQIKDQIGPVAVVELGDNDCCDASLIGSWIDQAMQALSGLHVIWLTGTGKRPGQESANQAIRAAAARWPDLQVADWAAVVNAHPDAVWTDGVHLNPSGEQLLASFIRSLLDGWYQRVGGPAYPIVEPFGPAPDVSPDRARLTNGATMGGAPTPSGQGFWLAQTDGGVLSAGDARFFGAAAGKPLNAPVVGMAATPDGGGYWLVSSDGGVFSFGNARFFGSAGALRLDSPVVGMAATPDGGGYWLVSSDGGIFCFGDAAFLGSTGGVRLNAPVVGMAAGPDGKGYWLASADGGVFSFGSAAFRGSLSEVSTRVPIQSMASTPDGAGYWLLDAQGGVYGFGDALSNATGTSRAPNPNAAAGPWFTVIIPRPGGGYWAAGQTVG